MVKIKFITFFFSGTGNTRWVVDQFNQIICKEGHQGIYYSIEDNRCKDISVLKKIILNSDYIGLANPIYGADIPPIMKDFIKKLDEAVELLNNENKDLSKNVYIINTFGYVNGFGPIAKSI